MTTRTSTTSSLQSFFSYTKDKLKKKKRPWLHGKHLIAVKYDQKTCPGSKNIAPKELHFIQPKERCPEQETLLAEHFILNANSLGTSLLVCVCVCVLYLRASSFPFFIIIVVILCLGRFLSLCGHSFLLLLICKKKKISSVTG